METDDNDAIDLRSASSNLKENRFEPGLKLALHPHLGKYLSGEKIFPINVEISPCGKCNAACAWCFYRQEQNSINGLDGSLFRESRMQGLIEELAGCGVKSISWTGGGEPSLHPSFPRFIEWAHWAGIQQGLFTNGLAEITYDPSLFEWIRVSKTNNDWNLQNLKILRQCKTLGLCINYRGTIDDEVVNQALKVAEILDNLKERKDHETYVQVRPALRIKGKFAEMIVPNIKHPLLKITTYKFFGVNNERIYDDCEAFHFAPFIWQDGDIDVCGYHRKNKNFNLGNLYDRGEKGRFANIMRKSSEKVQVIPECLICCKLNSMNTLIKNMRDLKDIHFP